MRTHKHRAANEILLGKEISNDVIDLEREREREHENNKQNQLLINLCSGVNGAPKRYGS